MEIKMTNHIYGVEIIFKGETIKTLVDDSYIDDAINKIYTDSSESRIRDGLRLLKNGIIPAVMIADSGDGGITTIRIIK